MLMLLMLCFWHAFCFHVMLSSQCRFSTLQRPNNTFSCNVMLCWLETTWTKPVEIPATFLLYRLIPYVIHQASCLFLLTCATCEDHDKLTCAWGWSIGLHNWLVPSRQPWRIVAFVLPTMSWWHPSCHLVQAFSYPKMGQSLGPDTCHSWNSKLELWKRIDRGKVTVPLHRVKDVCFAHHSGTFSPPPSFCTMKKSALRELSIFEKPRWLIP